MHLEARQLEEVKRVLAFYAGGYPVYAFGSRVHGRLLKPTSDLDLCVRGPEAMPLQKIEQLRDGFAISDLTMRVDVADWHYMSNDFRVLVERDFVLVQAADAPRRPPQPTSALLKDS